MIKAIRRVSLIAALSSTIFSQATLGQTTPPAFEVATIRPAAPAAGGGRASSSGDRVTLNNTTLLNALARAFGLVSAGQVAGPSWIADSRFDIVAKAPDNTPKEQIPSMLQTLLIDRFKLVLHHETRESAGLCSDGWQEQAQASGGRHKSKKLNGHERRPQRNEKHEHGHPRAVRIPHAPNSGSR